jgi:hypothetical protein
MFPLHFRPRAAREDKAAPDAQRESSAANAAAARAAGCGAATLGSDALRARDASPHDAMRNLGNLLKNGFLTASSHPKSLQLSG